MKSTTLQKYNNESTTFSVLYLYSEVLNMHICVIIRIFKYFSMQSELFFMSASDFYDNDEHKYAYLELLNTNIKQNLLIFTLSLLQWT
jgi:hypothetical protein